MENTIIRMPPPDELLRRVRREPRSVSWLPKRDAGVRESSNVQEVGRAGYVIGLNRQAEQIYGFANLVAVIVMAAALVAAFGIYLASFRAL
ncbi:MAG TPA: hypothetical protein VE242_07180 [Chthoniobacterales bacterium]|nr:hypothetical protein [Chthoniobacterales bacterium]